MPATGWRILHPWYDRLASLFAQEQQVTLQLVAQMKLETQDAWLDVGCGSGTLISRALDATTDSISRLPGRCEIACVGVDIDGRMLEWSRSKLETDGHDVKLLSGQLLTNENADRIDAEAIKRGQVCLVEADCANLPFKNDVFSTISCSRMFHHLTTDQKRFALQEMRRVARTDGALWLMDYGRPCNLWSRVKFLIVRLLDGFSTTRANVRGELPSLLVDAGWQEVEQVLQQETLLGTLRCYRAIAS